jgi:hypothetical protein
MSWHIGGNGSQLTPPQGKNKAVPVLEQSSAMPRRRTGAVQPLRQLHAVAALLPEKEPFKRKRGGPGSCEEQKKKLLPLLGKERRQLLSLIEKFLFIFSSCI